MLVQGFGGKLLALAEHELVEIGQHGRIEADGVFHEQNHLHTDFLDVVLQVHLVLNQLDDGHQQIGISQPAEHVFENAQVLVFHPFLDAMRKRSQHHQRQMRILPLDVAGNVEGVTVVGTRHTDDQVEHGVAQLLPCLLSRGHLGKTGRVAQAQVHVFIKNLLIDAAIVFEHERIVRIGH